MTEFQEMNILIDGNGKETLVEDLKKQDEDFVGVYKNDTYQVLVRKAERVSDSFPELLWLSIKRIDKEPIHDWRDLQEIKNKIVGKDHEGVELYPSESRKVDTANQYHMFVLASDAISWPFGFFDGRKVSSETPEKGEVGYGAKQRAFFKSRGGYLFSIMGKISRS
ncbi:MAG: hypothetical protein M0R03_17145 [Novosphingobium sp.]|nr:hypothetical protein [Novosphingobium sp.]